MCESGKELIRLRVGPVTGSCYDLFMTQKESEDTPVFISRVRHHRAFHIYFIYIFHIYVYTYGVHALCVFYIKYIM
jgi:hypothetical protein